MTRQAQYYRFGGTLLMIYHARKKVTRYPYREMKNASAFVSSPITG